MNTFTARIPYNVPRNISGIRYGPADLRWTRRGLPLLVNGDREPLGKVLHVERDATGISLVFDLGAQLGRSRAEEITRTGGGYYLEPITSRVGLLGFYVSALETWPSAEIRPTSSPAPAGRPSPRSPIGPRPEVNLAPIPTRPAIPPRPAVNLDPMPGPFR